MILGAQRAIQHFKPIIWTENVDYFDKGDTSFLAIMDQLNYACGKAQNAPNDLICTDKSGAGNQVGDGVVVQQPQAAGAEGGSGEQRQEL